MIQVPELVKDALRDGRRLKNYRFNVLKTVEHTTIVDLATLSASNDSYVLTDQHNNKNRIILHAESDGVARSLRGWVVFTDNSRQPFIFAMYADRDSFTEISMGILGVGTTIMVANIPSGISIGVTDTINVTTTTEEVTDFTIENANLVKESVKFDERMCSGDVLKFGLCEGSSLELQYFFNDRGEFDVLTDYRINDIVHYNGKTWRCKSDYTSATPTEGEDWTEWVTSNINGRRIQAFIDVDYRADSKEFVETDPESRYLNVTRVDSACSIAFFAKSNFSLKTAIASVRARSNSSMVAFVWLSLFFCSLLLFFT